MLYLPIVLLAQSLVTGSTLKAPARAFMPLLNLRDTSAVVDTTSPTTSSVPTGQVGTIAPSLAVTAWLNTPVPVHFGDGHVYVLGFTAWWCEACPRTYGPLMTIAQRYAKQGVRVIMATAFYGQDLDYTREYFQHYHLTLPIAVDGVPNGDMNSPNARNFAMPTMPWAIVIDPRGRIRFRLSGVDDSVSYLRTLTTVLDSLVPAPARNHDSLP